MPTEQDVHKLKIDEEFKRFIPPLSKQERKLLEENIIQDGCRDALCVWNKTIIDGHNRYEICTKHQIPFAIKYIFLQNRAEAIAWICANQLGRRNISEETRRYLIGKRYEMEKIVGPCNPNGRNQHTGKEVVYQVDTQPKFAESLTYTRDRLSSEYRIGTATINRYAQYAQMIDTLSQIAPELHAKIMSGKLRIPQDKIVEISRLNIVEMKSLCTEILQNPKPNPFYSDMRGVFAKSVSHKAQLAQMQIGAIKDMPEFDPDAEILSLALTIPSWISSINRVRISARFGEISDSVRTKSVDTLNELNAAIEIIIAAIEEKS